jgi:outer membrane protein OmpA-like peptidoglycan-associated protein
MRYLIFILLFAFTPLQAAPPEALTKAAIEAGLDPLVPRGARGPEGVAPDFPTVMASIQFDTNQASIKYESVSVLRAYGEALSGERLSRAVVAICGHTDSDGEDDYNLLLSHRRAQAVKDFLLREFNIKDNRLRVEAYGESRPIAANSHETGKAQNRRVEFVRLGWLE